MIIDFTVGFITGVLVGFASLFLVVFALSKTEKEIENE